MEPASTLAQFVAFLEREGATHITTALALQWAMAPQGVQRATWARRLSMVRRFATWLHARDPQTEVPPYGALPARRRRRRPHIFTDDEVRRLMAETAHHRSRTGLRPLTYTTLIGLLAATGLRPGEALALDIADVNLDAGLLTIRQSKFGKSRVVPVDDSTRDALRQDPDSTHGALPPAAESRVLALRARAPPPRQRDAPHVCGGLVRDWAAADAPAAPVGTRPAAARLAALCRIPDNAESLRLVVDSQAVIPR